MQDVFLLACSCVLHILQDGRQEDPVFFGGPPAGESQRRGPQGEFDHDSAMCSHGVCKLAAHQTCVKVNT